MMQFISANISKTQPRPISVDLVPFRASGTNCGVAGDVGRGGGTEVRGQGVRVRMHAGLPVEDLAQGLRVRVIVLQHEADGRSPDEK